MEAEALTLEELKKRNEQEEKGEQTQPEKPEVEVKPEDVPRETSEEQEETAEIAEETTEEPKKTEEPEETAPEIEADSEWMKPDESQEEQKETGFKPNADAAAARKKYRRQAQEKQAELERERQEKEELRKRLEALEKGQKLTPQSYVADRPKRENFDSEEAYEDALYEFRREQDLAKNQSAIAAAQKRKEAEEQLKKIQEASDAHYVRAHELCEKSKIAPETYQKADETIRTVVDNIFPDNGDAMVDFMIYKLGAGSEKVMYNLAVNSSRRQHFIDLLKNDKSGLSASIFLGELKAKLSAPEKRETKAPKPVPQVAMSGDRKDKSVAIGAKVLREKYMKAHQSGNAQAAFDYKRQARNAGVDTSDWAI